MAIQKFDLSIQAEGTFIGDRNWTGAQSHATWNVENMNVNDRSEWGVNADGWLQYRSTLSSYSIRFNALDVALQDTYLETEMSAGGTGNYEMGVVFRYKDRNNYYYMVFNGGYQNWGGKNIRLMKRTGTSDIQLADHAIPVFDRTKSYRVRVEVIGANIKIWLDGALIFNYTDSFPISNGAFGPIVKGQEFARWRFFGAKSISSFTVTNRKLGFEVPHTNYDAATSKLLFPDTVFTLMESEINRYLTTVVYESYKMTRFIVTSTNPKTSVLFDKVPGKNITIDSNSRIYAFQLLPTTPPIQPTNLQGQAIDHESIKLRWVHVDDSEDGFHILDENDNILYTVGENVNEYIETGLDEGTTYSRKVVSFNTAGMSVPSNLVLVTTFQTAPAPPDLFRGVALSDKKIQWSWDDMSFNENVFEVVDLSGPTPVVIKVLNKNETTWTEDGLTALTEYTRAIRSKNTAGTSELSNAATVKTMDERPNPPEFAPYNFAGVGISHDSILWTWMDKNVVVDGYHIYDEFGKLIKTVLGKLTRSFVEDDLLSAMEYRRSISAFNKGGEGPRTLLAWAKTLKYGQDQTGTPLEPFNLIVHTVTTESAILEWDYNEHEMMPAIGFKIYNELDQLIAVTGIGEQTKLIEYLVPDTSYTAYVVAYNEVGDSLPSNNISWVTEPIAAPAPEIPDELPEDWIDPYYGIEYDVETEDTPKIPAFHAGVGDNLDLVVHNLHNIIPNEEEFTYDMYVKGGYLVDEEYYPEVPFSYRVNVEGTYSNGTTYNSSSNWTKGIVQGGENGEGLRHDAAVNMKPIPDDVAVTPSSYSVEFLDENGNPLPPISNELTWIFESKISEQPVGVVEDIDMFNVFERWKKFSHNGTNKQPASPADMNAWVFQPLTGEILTTVNSATYMGAVSPDAYNNYDINVLLRSNNSDNDRMGFVMAFAYDDAGKEHTLSAIRNHEGQFQWAIWYDYMQSGAFMIDQKNIDVTTSGWNVYYPEGTHLRIKRSEGVFEAWASAAGSRDITEASKLTVDLSSDARLAVFDGPKQIGVSANSQAGAALKITSFVGEKTRITVKNYMTVFTNKRAIRSVVEEWKGAVQTSGVHVVKEGEILEFEGRIQSPKYQIPWQEASKIHNFLPNGYRLIVTSNNPNIKLMLVDEVSDFFPADATFVRMKLRASIINKDQTKWHPSIHTGYYYLNQRENFLFSDHRVLPKEGNDIKQYKYSFPYILRAYAERHYTGGDVLMGDDHSSEFLLGKPSGGIVISPVDDTMTLKETAKSESFVSRLFDFGRIVEVWNPPLIKGDEVAAAYGAKVEIEIGETDSVGNVIAWRRPNVMVPAQRVRYRLSLKEGHRKQKYTEKLPQVDEQLSEGYISNVIVGSNSIQLRDPALNAEGHLITRPIHIGDQVDEVGTVELNLNLPEGSSVQLFSVTAKTAQHRFDIPTSTEPWIPLRLKTVEGNHRTYIIDSIPQAYLSIVVRLIRSAETPDLDAQSPVVEDMIVYPQLYEMIRVAPTVDSVTLGGFIPAGYWVEDFTVPLMGEIIGDQMFHKVSDKSIEDTVLEYIASIGVNDIEGLTFKDYFGEVDSQYDVELKVDTYGKQPLEARTTAVVGELIYQQEKLYFDPKDRSLVVRPIPQNGSPIVIKNAQGKTLKQVHFRDEQGKPTLYCIEDLETNDTRNVFLRYHESDIDRESMEIHLELEKGNWIEIYGAVLVQNRIVLPTGYLPFLNMRVMYRLKDSFCVDYNYNPAKDHALITVNTSFDKEVKETTLLDIKYEINKEHPYYLGNEINMNPLYNKIHSGFIYLADELFAPYKMDVVCNPNTLYRTRHEKVSVHAYLYDENGNPVVGEKVSWEALHGGLEVKSFITDMNGMVTAIYQVPQEKRFTEDTITAKLIGRKASTHLSKSVEVTISDETFSNKISIVPEKHIVQSGDTVQLKITALGPSHERIPNRLVTISSNEGVVVPATGRTDYNGELLVQYRHPSNSTIDYVIIETEDGETKEQIILGVSGV